MKPSVKNISLIVAFFVVAAAALAQQYSLKNAIPHQPSSARCTDLGCGAAETSNASSSARPFVPSGPLAERSTLYSNARFGFSVLIPTYLSQSPSQCEYSPFPINGYPVKVVEDGDVTYITPAMYGDLPYDEALSSFGPCFNVDVTLETIEKDMLDSTFYYHGWKMVGQKNIANDADLLSFIRQWYGSGCGIQAKTPPAHPGTFDVEIAGYESDSTAQGSSCPLNFLYAVKYSPEKQTAVLWKIGQDGRFEDMDMEMAASFRFE